VRTLVLDMEGVLVLDWQPIPGSPRAVERLRAAGIELAILTNTTGRSRAEIAERLHAAGIEFAPERIVTAASATADHLRAHHPGASVHLLGEPGAAAEFAGLELVDDPAAAGVVVMAGPDDGLTYTRLNAAFRAVVGGTPLVAMQRNRWWPTAAGPAMDAGGYVAAIEYASGVEATVVGKPSAGIYRAALRICGAVPADALMVGDDLVSDLRPASALGMATCLVRTGKGASFRPDPGEVTHDLPDLAALAGRLLS
jgi:HAD superfamily hydrolase (TIGR01458 family)